ncbi:hypothetical protein G6M87_09240 [Rhizobium rhizogenes]|uniref:hypothetical protein n=1 Tax=Rhizobium rhizogenes TaxID=359 RepID=UPI0015741D3A|nr:hypothetical protein [Rhizobium rhizogenes]NTG48574.1 hypothetical protein [Rhizobium rhizogenes]NTI22046.1 hypothetical protein [Rhizobium rhizogenes]QTG05650.1 hypothetical protein G6M87_09240 [Rhizobium rhizogenes]
MAEKVKEVQGADFGVFDAFLRAQENGIAVEIVDPNSKPIGLQIVICGPDSERMQKAIAEVTATMAAEAAKRDDLGDEPSDAGDKRMISILAKSIVSWGPKDPVVDGTPLTCNEANAKALLTRYRFVRDQIEFKAQRRSSFMQG